MDKSIYYHKNFYSQQHSGLASCDVDRDWNAYQRQFHFDLKIPLNGSYCPNNLISSMVKDTKPINS